MRKFFVAILGGTSVLIGTVMLVLPGPGLLVIAAAMVLLFSAAGFESALFARDAMSRTKPRDAGVPHQAASP